MRITTWKRVNKEDLGRIPKAMEKAVEGILKPVNGQLEKLTDLANGRGTFGDNFNSERVTIAVKNGVEKPVTLRKLKGKAVDAILTNPGRYHATNAIWPKPLLWTVLDQKTVAIRVSWDDAPAGEHTVRIWFFGE